MSLEVCDKSALEKAEDLILSAMEFCSKQMICEKYAKKFCIPVNFNERYLSLIKKCEVLIDSQDEFNVATFVYKAKEIREIHSDLYKSGR